MKTSLSKMSVYITKAIYAILAMFPLLLGSIYGIINFLGDWTWLYQSHDKEYYSQPFFAEKKESLLIFIIVFLVIASLVYLINKRILNIKKDKKWSGFSVLVVIFFITVLLRVGLLILFYGQIHPFSDFAKAWNRANGDLTSLDYYRFFPGYINYSLLLKIVSKVFAGSYMAVLWICIICNGITGCFVYLIGKELFSTTAFALLAAMIYGFNPSAIVYSLTATPEHIAIACFSCAVYLVLRWMNEKNKKNIFFLVLAGLVSGVGDSIKTFFPIVIFAAFIVIVLEALGTKRRNFFERLAIGMLGLLLVFAIEKITISAITFTSEKVFDVELDFADATPHYFNVGLNSQGEGQIGIGEMSRLYITERTEGISLEEAKRNMIIRLKEDWAVNSKDIPSFLVKKTIWSWQDDTIPFKYFQKRFDLICDDKVEEWVFLQVSTLGVTISQYWYIFSMVLGFIGACFLLRFKNESEINWKFIFTNIIIIGYFCLILLSEGQSRYKCLMIPYLCLLDAYAINKLMYGVSKIWKKS